MLVDTQLVGIVVKKNIPVMRKIEIVVMNIWLAY